MEYTILSIHWPTFFVLVLVSAVCLLALTRRTYFSWFDPLFQYLALNCLGTAFLLYMALFQDGYNSFYFTVFSISILAFVCGLLLGTKKLPRKFQNNQEQFAQKRLKNGNALTLTLLLMMCVTFLANYVLYAKFGTLPSFAENPSIAKVTFRVDGYGLIFRINDTLIPACFAIIATKLFHPYLKPKRKMQWLLLLSGFLCAAILLTTGSKAALFVIIFVIAQIYLINKSLGIRSRVKQINRYVGLLFVAAIFGFAYILLSSNTGTFDFSESLIIRLLASGENFYWFNAYDLYPQFHLSALDFLDRSLNPLFALFRLTEYRTSIGELILFYAIGVPPNGFGPNSAYYVEGLVFFGPVLGILYSFGVGWVVSAIRTQFLSVCLNRADQASYAFYILLSVHVMRLPSESNYFLISVFNTLLFVLPLFVVAKVFLGISAGTRRQLSRTHASLCLAIK